MNGYGTTPAVWGLHSERDDLRLQGYWGGEEAGTTQSEHRARAGMYPWSAMLGTSEYYKVFPELSPTKRVCLSLSCLKRRAGLIRWVQQSTTWCETVCLTLNPPGRGSQVKRTHA